MFTYSPPKKTTPWFLVFDTETTGLPKDYAAPYTDSENWPRIVQLGYIIIDQHFEILKKRELIIYPEGYQIPAAVTALHGIDTEKARTCGTLLYAAIEEFRLDAMQANVLVAHNAIFDMNMVAGEIYRVHGHNPGNRFLWESFFSRPVCCTMEAYRPQNKGYRIGLKDLHIALTGKGFEKAHTAMADVLACGRVFYRMTQQGIIDIKQWISPKKAAITSNEIAIIGRSAATESNKAATESNRSATESNRSATA